MASIFLKVSGVTGSVSGGSDATKAGMLVDDFNAGSLMAAYRNARTHIATSAGRPTFSNVTFSKTQDAGSGSLMKALLMGQALKDVEFTMVANSEKPDQPLSKWRFPVAYVASCTYECDSSRDLPVEKYSLAVQEVEYTVTAGTGMDGAAGGNTGFHWDFSKNQPGGQGPPR
jgi:type VI protein secretion system component Hcp